MATVAEVQAQLGVEGKAAQIIKTADSATLRQNYTLGGAPRRGNARWVTTTIADSAATQAAAILAGLIRG